MADTVTRLARRGKGGSDMDPGFGLWLFAVSLAATSEAFVMGAKGGLDPELCDQIRLCVLNCRTLIYEAW